MKDSSDVERFHQVQTEFGSIVVMWRGRAAVPVVTRIHLPGEWTPPSRHRGRGAIENKSCPRIDDLAAQLRALCAGKPADIDLDILDLGSCGAFQRAVLIAESGIPRGRVSTYGRIARYIGHSGAARAVGSALGRNPFPLAIPCHRAVREGGGLGGYRGGLAMKRRLLELEGVQFSGQALIDMREPWYDEGPSRIERRRRNRRERT